MLFCKGALGELTVGGEWRCRGGRGSGGAGGEGEWRCRVGGRGVEVQGGGRGVEVQGGGGREVQGGRGSGGAGWGGGEWRCRVGGEGEWRCRVGGRESGGAGWGGGEGSGVEVLDGGRGREGSGGAGWREGKGVEWRCWMEGGEGSGVEVLDGGRGRECTVHMLDAMFADDPTSSFSPPELAVASPLWTKVTAEKAYLYSLGHTLLQGVESTKEQVGVGDSAFIPV